MKILVTETFLHFLPNGLGWIEGFQDLGHTAYALQSHVNSINEIDEELDILVFMGMHTVKYDDVVKFKDRWPDTKLVAVCFGFDESYLKLKPYIHTWVEHNYKHSIVDSLFKEAGMKLIHVPLASSTRLFNKVQIETAFDVSFIGQFGENKGHGYREQDYYLDPILKSNLKGFYSGFYNYPNVHVTSLNQIYNSTKVNINFHYPNQKLESENITDSVDFNSRVFDIAMSGNFQLCDHPYVEEVFSDGLKYTSKENWLDTLNYYLNNEEERIMLSKKAYEECLSKHTWQKRMEQFLNQIQ